MTESSSEIVLNAAELTIDKAVVEAGGKQVSVSGTSVDEESERLTLGLGESLAAGPTRLSIYIEFTGFLNDQLRGFYRSVFTPPGTPEGTIETIATTHFESTDTRGGRFRRPTGS